jgi:uncharacterized protein YjbI with pentapeptide repeats
VAQRSQYFECIFGKKMIEPNPHRRIARIFAFTCYVVAGLVLCFSLFPIYGAATMNMAEIRGVEGLTNAKMTVMVGSIFAIVVLMLVLLGWRVQKVFGQHRRTDKPVARAAVGCLRLGSLGCGLWALPSGIGVIFTGQLLSTGEPAGVQDLFVGASAFIIAITLMLSVAWFISANFVHDPDLRRVYQAYVGLVHAELPGMADPETRAHLQKQTLDLLTKLDQTLKGKLLEDLSKARLLTGSTRIILGNADFRGVDLCLSNLPEADLPEINLEGARLEGALLSKVNLYKARLKRCNLSRARLQEANLLQADLTEAVLYGAKLRAANLNGAILEKANLSQANLQGANLRYANLEGAVLKETDLRGADLTGTIVTAEQLRQANL